MFQYMFGFMMFSCLCGFASGLDRGGGLRRPKWLLRATRKGRTEDELRLSRAIETESVS